MRVWCVSFLLISARPSTRCRTRFLCNKLKELPISPYIINWIIDFLTSRYQRVVIDGIKTDYLPINRGVPQGTVLGPILFSIMINDIRPVQVSNLIVKFADDINLGIKVTDDSDTSHMETNNIKIWAETNRMKLKLLKKTWEMVIHGKISRPLPEPLPMITRKKLFEDIRCNVSRKSCHVGLANE